jgi:hypothetical protein
MKNYGMPFKNAAIDKMSGKFGKDKPTHQNVDFKANAQKRIEERSDVRNPMAWNYETDYNSGDTKISSLKNPSKTYFDNVISDRGYKGQETHFNRNAAQNEEKSTGSSSLAFWTGDKMKVSNTYTKMRTLAPSYVDSKGPKTLQGVKSKKKK